MRFPVLSLIGLLGVPVSVASAQETSPQPAPPLVLPVPTAVTPTVEPAAAPLTLDDCLQLALKNHGDIASARQTLTASAQRVTSAKANRAPQLAATVGTNYQNGQLVTGNFAQTGVTSTLNTGVTLSQNIFDSGRTKYSVRQSRASATAQLGGLGSARSSIAYQVAQSYYEQLRQERLSAQRQKQVEVAQAQIDQIQARIEAGDAPRSDLAGVRVTLSQAQFDLVTAQNDLRTARANLRNALGLDRGAPLELAYQSPQTFETGLPLEEALAEAEKRRPDLLASRAQVAASEAAFQTAKIDARPNVTASAGYNLDPRETSDRKFSLGATVDLPLFNGGGRRSDARAAGDELQSARINLEQTQKDVQTDVETAVTDVAGQVDRLKNARELVQSAQNNLDVATGKYQAGAGIALDVTTAASQLFEAQTSLTSAEFDYQVSRSNLDRAIGRYAWEGEAVPDPTQVIESLRH